MESDRSKPTSLLAAGLVTWLVVAAPLIYLLFVDPDAWRSSTVRWWFVAWSVFGAAYGVLHWPRTPSRSIPISIALLGIQTLAAIWANALVPIVFEGVAIGGVLFVIVAGQLIAALPILLAALWVVLQSAALIWVYLVNWPAPIAFLAGGAYACFQVFALFVASLAARERAGRLALDQTLSELRATQALLEESTRLAERTRIARDLHDVLGHRLAALSILLEAAAHREGDDAAAHVREARALSGEMLGEVRAVVGALRREGPIDLRRALERLVNGRAAPRAHLEIPTDFAVDPPDRAMAMLRVVQEAHTNAMRHSGAANIWITLRHEEREAVLEVRDDGCGVDEIHPGHGLRGMRERFEAFGGSIRWHSEAGGGVHLEGRLPRHAGASS
jgi:signal transduction histidine kinase